MLCGGAVSLSSSRGSLLLFWGFLLLSLFLLLLVVPFVKILSLFPDFSFCHILDLILIIVFLLRTLLTLTSSFLLFDFLLDIMSAHNHFLVWRLCNLLDFFSLDCIFSPWLVLLMLLNRLLLLLYRLLCLHLLLLRDFRFLLNLLLFLDRLLLLGWAFSLLYLLLLN